MTDKELVKALREHAEWARANEQETPVTLGDNLADAADVLEKLSAQVPQWIPVTEQLPDDDDGDWCLVYADGQEGYLVCRGAVVCADYDWATGNFYDGSLCITNLVRYWMPMPEPPEEDL